VGAGQRDASPRFSIVIAAFNAARTVTSAISSALSQTCSDVEVIVVDDGSSDDTVCVVEEIADGRVKLIRQRERGGPARARNAGIAASRGEYVTSLDSDDLLLPRYLEVMSTALDEAVQPGFAYTDAYAFKDSTGRVRHRTAMQKWHPRTPPPRDRDSFLLELLKRNFVYTAVTVPRAVLEEVGGYDTRPVRSEDYLLSLKILTHGYNPVWVPGQHAMYRIGGMRTSDMERMRSGLVTIYNAVELDEMPTEAHRELLLRRRRWAEREVQLERRERRLAWEVRQLRHRLGRIRQRIGLGDSWYEAAPQEVAAAFPDLRAV
jgi:GT2 family glycosyltransferase